MLTLPKYGLGSDEYTFREKLFEDFYDMSFKEFACYVEKSFNHYMKTFDLACSQRTKVSMIMQSIVGNAKRGHVGFKKANQTCSDGSEEQIFFDHVDLEDITRALCLRGKNPDKINAETEKRFREESVLFPIEYLIRQMLSGCPNQLSYNFTDKGTNKKRIIGEDYYLERKSMSLQQIEKYLTGAVLGALMDSVEYRKKLDPLLIEEGIPLMKLGTCEPVDLVRLYEKCSGYGFNPKTVLSELSNKEVSNDLFNKMIDDEVILTTPVVSSPRYITAYILLREGLGGCDDSGFTSAGINHGLEVAMWVYLLDKIDTYDKFSSIIVPGGKDEAIGKKILEIRPNLVPEEMIAKHILSTSIGLYDCIGKHVSSSSQRELMQVKGKKSKIENIEQYIIERNANIGIGQTDRIRKSKKKHGPKRKQKYKERSRIWNYRGRHKKFFKSVEAQMKEVSQIDWGKYF